jgi:hypothetical protein
MKNIKWGAEKRLEFIDFRLFWEGVINRADIMKQFSVSVPQASKDLSFYQQQAPNNIIYDKSAKHYYRSKVYKPVFFEPNTQDYLLQLKEHTENTDKDNWISIGCEIDIMPTPRRKVCPNILQKLLNAVRKNKSISIKYQSMNPNKPDPMWRDISPHAFCSDGYRWHVRGYCHEDNKFKDFLLSRMIEVGDEKEIFSNCEEDRLWYEFFNVLLIPNLQLSDNQKKIIEKDYNMVNGVLSVSVRYSLLYYFFKRHRLDIPPQTNNLLETPIMIKNKQEFDAALAKARG